VAKLIAGTLSVEALAMAFEVKRGAGSTPNACSIEVRNLNEDSRKTFEGAKGLPVELYAGYGEPSRIFKGTLRLAITTLAGQDVITSLECGDSEKEISTARVSVTIAPGDSPDSVMSKAAEALGVGLGNLSSVLARVATMRSILPKGGALHGSAARAMDRVCKAHGYTWSVQDGQLLILDANPVSESAELIGPQTGLTGSPKVDNKGLVSFDCALRPSLAIGESFQLKSRFVSGGYRVIELTHKGDTHGQTWTTSVVCNKV
jgi:hypothetical protein